MQLGWIDFSKTERNKILSVLDLLSESGTLDELGIAPVRDGFANLFFPGTSTIQTRAKYFFIVPYALKELELGAETNPGKVLAALDKIEKNCGEIFLSRNYNESGVIGSVSLKNKRWVKNPPSSIYWAGLRRYGIFTGGNMTLSEYVRAACALKSQKTTLQDLGNRNDNAEENERDDKNAGNLFKMQFWKMPLYKKEWMNTLAMPLTKEEGAFLKDQIIQNCPDTMLYYILKYNMTDILELQSFKDLGAYMPMFPSQIQADYKLALSFSDFMQVVRAVYNVIIYDGQNEAVNSDLEYLHGEMQKRANIDIDLILSRLHITKNALRVFLKRAQACMLSKDIESMKKIITAHEINLKGESRAKTMHPGEFSNERINSGQLDYRFYNTKIILNDIFESEGKTDV